MADFIVSNTRPEGLNGKHAEFYAALLDTAESGGSIVIPYHTNARNARINPSRKIKISKMGYKIRTRKVENNMAIWLEKTNP